LTLNLFELLRLGAYFVETDFVVSAKLELAAAVDKLLVAAAELALDTELVVVAPDSTGKRDFLQM
jgi:hypothetical protein